jgi:hypothetical protein
MLLKENSRLVEVKKSKSGSKYKVFHFDCTECKKGIKAQISHLKTHSGKCTSCAQKKEPYLFIYNELKNHRNRNVDFDLSFNELLEFINKPECHYCNTKLIYHKHSRGLNGLAISRAHHLDRKDNSLGYKKENVVQCCWECNRLKSDRFSYDEFIQLKPILIKIMNDRLI